MVTLTLSSDHRVVDGARAAEFVRDLASAISNPQQYFNNA
jgi:pyruvate dehydrogenase E2 component (dihydrolipoamide acetyltransferase)